MVNRAPLDVHTDWIWFASKIKQGVHQIKCFFINTFPESHFK